MRLYTGLIAIGLAALLPCASAKGQEQGSSSPGTGNLFQRALRVSGQLTKMTGEAMSNMARGREETLLGKGLGLGGKVNQTVGQMVENAADGKRGDGVSVSTGTKVGKKARATGAENPAAPRSSAKQPRRNEPDSQKSEGLFTQSLRLSGQMTKMTGEAMSGMAKGREDSLLGKGLALGGRVNEATGKVVEDSADNHRGVAASASAVTHAGLDAVSPR